MKKNFPWVLLFLVIAGLIGRIIVLQIKPDERVVERLGNQSNRFGRTCSTRGPILDRRGEPLAISVPTASLYVDPRDWNTDNADKLSEWVSKEKTAILSSLKRGRFYWVLRQQEDEKAKKILDMGLDGLHVLQETKRIYPNETLLSHVLGYCDIDGIGLAGLELMWNDVLYTPSGWTMKTRGRRDSTIGGSEGKVFLTVDRRIQYILEKRLSDISIKEKVKWGAALCLESDTGRIVGMASWPSFNANKRTTLNNDSMTNNCISRVYEPGSTLKPVIVAMALQSKIVGRNSWFIDNGRIKVADGWISNSHGRGKGKIDLSDVLIYSSNVGMAQIGIKLNPYEAYRDLEAWGFGKKTGVELNGEENGLLLPPERWYGVIPANVAIGQGIAVTPIQLITAFNAVINGGKLLLPHIVDRVEDGERKPIYRSKTVVLRDLLPPHYVDWFRKTLRRVIVEGTGKKADCKEVKIGGKTGTAQVAVKGEYSKERMVASFIGFWPYDSPEYTLLVVLGEPGQGRYYGGAIAAPVFKAIVEDIERLNSGE